MATPPREGWDGGDERGRERSRLAREAGRESWGEWVREREAESRYDSICGRRNRSDEPCGRPEAGGVPEKDSGPCKDHGGRSPRGRAHPSYSHGERVETTFPKGILESAREFFDQDPQRTLQENKAVLLHMRNELLEEIEGSAGPALRETLSEKFERMRDAESPEELRSRLSEAFAVVRSGVEADAARERCLEILRELRATADAQRRLFVDLHEVVEKPKLLTLVDRVGQAVDRAVESNVTEETVREVLAESSDPDDFARRLKRLIYRDLYASLGRIVGRSDSSPSRENGGAPARP